MSEQDFQFNKLEEEMLETEEQMEAFPAFSAGKNHKIAYAGMVFFAVMALVFWAVDFKNNLPVNKIEPPAEGSAEAEKLNETALLQSSDTDKDGLSDYDERYAYGTSPYLEDSDSDGRSDKDEIAAGTNPICPEGSDCSLYSVEEQPANENGGTVTSSGAPSAGLSQTEVEALLNLGKEQGYIEDSGSGASNDVTEKLLKGEADAATLRAFLLEYGMSEDVLKNFNDSQLLSAYQEIVKEGE